MKSITRPLIQRWTPALAAVLLVALAACSSTDSTTPTTRVPVDGSNAGPGGPLAKTGTTRGTVPSTDPALAAKLEGIAKTSMDTYHLKSIVVRATRDGKEVYTAAMGESMTGVPATTEMNWRNGAFAFTYIGEIFAQLVDQKKVSLDDKLSKWMPQLPNADKVTIKNLLNMTSGYADYVYTPEVIDGVELTPFKQWTNDELISIGMSKPIEFEPGTNWGYSHTNYVILGEVLEKLLGKPVPAIMDEYIIKPMGLTSTSSNADTPAIPEPVLHGFSSERRERLQVPPSLPLYEESTFWNPSWTTAEGAVQTTNIYDVTTSMEFVGSGKLVSPEMHQAQTGKNLVGFGSKDPTGLCKVCSPLTEDRSYGLGVVLLGNWITQTKNFSGSGATGGYLPSDKLTISVVTTYLPEAFDPQTGAYENASSAIFDAMANAAAPTEPPGSAPAPAGS